MHLRTNKLLNFLTRKPRKTVDRLSRSCSSSNELALLFPQSSNEVDVESPLTNIPSLPRSKTLTNMDMIMNDHQLQSLPLPSALTALDHHDQSRKGQNSQMPRRSSTSYADLCLLISEISVNDAIVDCRLEEAAAPSIADPVDDNYWDMPSEPAYGSGMTVARKESKECAVEHLQERIRLARRKAAEPDHLCTTDVATDCDSLMTSDDGCGHDNYWDWHTPEHPQEAPLSIPPPECAGKQPRISATTHEDHIYWNFPQDSPYGSLTVARKEERELAMLRILERLSHYHAQHWHWNNAFIPLSYMHS